MNDEQIRLNSTDSVNSVDRENFLDVEIKQHTKVFPFGDVIDTIDQRRQFETERENCTKYRLILTVNPYCSNILFNTVTEIVQNEGSDKTNNEDKLRFVNSNSNGISVNDTGGYSIRGKQTNVTNVDMVRNTEYANGERPFVYHCGWDIFNNHILRNQTFKLVNSYISKPTDTIFTKDKDGNVIDTEKNVNVFNTIRDFMRDANGDYIKLHRRTDIDKIDTRDKKRLYLGDDVLSFEDSMNANIYEQNGWFGFNNRSSIVTTEWKDDIKEWKDMQTAKVFNNEDSLACGFIEMYPDSSLYSFSPKYNKFQNREEHNWDICITYPYKNNYGYEYNEDTNTIDLNKKNIKLIVTKTSDNDIINALLLANVRKTKGTSGQDILSFRSFVKHNLKTGDKFKLFYSLDKETYTEIKDILFEVVNIGNLESEYQDYYFYINNIQDVYDNIGSEILDDYSFRFIKVVNNRECKYYFRKFKKLPNFKFKKRDLTDEDVDNNENFKKYIDENCSTKEGKMLLFSKEQYPLAFSNTVYGDGNTQIVFTDSIDIDKLTDNLGRPITELYITFIKRNKGHNVWYKIDGNKTDYTQQELKEIEFSHCFSKVISGLKMHNELGDSDELKDLRKELNDITCITTKDKILFDEDIDIDNTDEFYGDLVELNQGTMKETVLSDVCFRFNTEQRENGTFEKKENDTIEHSKCGKYVYDAIITDDYDYDGFVCDANELDVANIIRKEGYYYKAHYPIKVREFGAMRQGSHKEIKVSSCKPKQSNGMFIEVVSTLRSGVTSGSIIYLYDTEQNNKKVAELTVNSVQSSVRFLLNTMKKEDDNYTPIFDYISIFDIVKGLLYSERVVKEGEKWTNENGLEEIAEEDDMKVKDYSQPKYIMRLKNIDIPHYAYEVGENSNVFLWRDVLNVGNKDTVELTEYPFANGHFYINKEINFFLKRQDPFGYNGLYASELYPNDIYGNVKEENIYEYKDETNVVC